VRLRAAGEERRREAANTQRRCAPTRSCAAACCLLLSLRGDVAVAMRLHLSRCPHACSSCTGSAGQQCAPVTTAETRRAPSACSRAANVDTRRRGGEVRALAAAGAAEGSSSSSVCCYTICAHCAPQLLAARADSAIHARRMLTGRARRQHRHLLCAPCGEERARAGSAATQSERVRHDSGTACAVCTSHDCGVSLFIHGVSAKSLVPLSFRSAQTGLVSLCAACMAHAAPARTWRKRRGTMRSAHSHTHSTHHTPSHSATSAPSHPPCAAP
jgi:hypothetical protein